MIASWWAFRSGIIPAYAGSTRCQFRRRRRHEDHPRIRGEHKRINAETENAPGSSPHTRGARPGRRARPHFPWIIPAYAGSTCSRAVRARTERDHPRIRGEHQEALVGILGAAGSSPHTRGAPGRRLALVLRVGIIPAYAGSTRSPTTPTSPDWDHPRIRGEHRTPCRLSRLDAGSSPHTRGAQAQFDRDKLMDGIIPAYAGSTGCHRPVDVS